MLTRTDPLCAQVSVGEAELNSVTDGADDGIIQPSSVGPLSEYSQWKRRVLEQVLKSEKIYTCCYCAAGVLGWSRGQRGAVWAKGE